MKSMLKIGFAVVLASGSLAVNEAQASCLDTLSVNPPKPPHFSVDCSTVRNLKGYKAGVSQGMSIVDSIWYSDAVDEDVANWTIFSSAVSTTLPTIVTAFLATPGLTDYVKCRAQGILDAAPCQMLSHNPSVECALDGEYWGYISGKIYCDLSIALEGLADPGTWTSQPPNICSENFELLCPITYDYVSTYILDLPTPRPGPVTDPVTDWVTPRPVLPVATCGDYTKDGVAGDFATIYANSRKFDCTWAY